MKIVFIGGRDIHKLGGIENYMFNLATQLAKLGHEAIVFCESNRNRDEHINGFRVIYQKGPNNVYLCKPWLGLKSTLKAIFKIKKVDFIHYNTFAPAYCILLPRLLGQKAILQGHGLEWERTKYSSFKRTLIKRISTTITRMSKYVIMCSEAQSQYFNKEYGLNCTTIPTAINLPNYDIKIKSDILKRYNLIGKKYFLFMARIVPEKNPHILINAFIRANVQGYYLVIAGDNDADISFVEECHELAKGCDSIIFTGSVYGDDKEMLLRNAFSFCVPSTIEGLSISLLEGMANRLPIIASDIPANREVLEEDKAFWSIPEDTDSLAKSLILTTQSNDLKTMTEYNFNKVSTNYTWEVVAKKYISYLESIL